MSVPAAGDVSHLSFVDEGVQGTEGKRSRCFK